jgi:copper transport protein
VTGAIAVGLLAVVAAGGHAMAGNNTTLGFPATVVHLAGMSIWFGGLALIALALPRAESWSSASAFSPWAFGSVVVLAVSGSANAWRQLGSFSNLVDSSFGRWLVIKLVLVLMVVVIASFSRRTVQLAVDDDRASRSLHRTVSLEAAGIVIVLMATAGLVNAPPPPPAAEGQSASVIVGERIVQVELEPAVTNGAELHVYLTSPGGGLDQADEITVQASLPPADLGPIDIEVVPAGPNHVTASSVTLPVAGRWTFDVIARFGEFDQVTFSVELPVSD